MIREIWDVYDKNENKKGFEHYRDQPLEKGSYHIVVEIYTITKSKEVLITKRHKDKPWALKWEITGGSIVKGETPEIGALRELKEETGIQVKESDLNYVYTHINDKSPAIYKCYIVFINKEKTNIILQEGETIDYKFLPYSEFKSFIKTDEYVDSLTERFLLHEKLFDDVINKKKIFGL